MAQKEDNLSEYLGKYVQLSDGRKGFVLAPSDQRDHYQFLILKNRHDEMTFSITSNGYGEELHVWRELGTMSNGPMQPGVLINDIRSLMEDGKRFRELQRLLK